MTDNNVPSATDNTISNASAEAEKTKLTEEQAKVVQAYAKGLLHAMTKHNTPFDGRVRNKKRAKARLGRKANKKRKLYLRRRKYGN